MMLRRATKQVLSGQFGTNGKSFLMPFFALTVCIGCESKRIESLPATKTAAADSVDTSPAPVAKASASIPVPALEAAKAKLTTDAGGAVLTADLRGCKLDDAVLAELAQLTSLQQLDLRECSLSNQQLSTVITPMKKLRALRLSGKGGATTVDDAGLAALAGCTDLRVLAVDELFFSEDCLKKLSGCKNLAELYVSASLIDDAAMETVASFKQLKKIRLAKTSVSAAGLKALGGLKLEDLDLSECSQINDEALEVVANWKTLKRLNLWRDPVSDAGCSKLAGLTQLNWYNLDNTQLTDAGLDHLAGMVELTFLHLGSTGVSDAGMPKLFGLTKLKDLKVTRTGVTDAGAKVLTDKLPNLKVQVIYREEEAP